MLCFLLQRYGMSTNTMFAKMIIIVEAALLGLKEE